MQTSYLQEVCNAASVDAGYLQALRNVVSLMSQQWEQTHSRSALLAALPSYCCAAVGTSQQAATKVTSAWAVLYAALHMLDSIEDADTPDASWAQWGAGAAINLSTGLIASTGSILCTLEQAGVPSDAAQDIRLSFFRTLLQMSNGQHADLTLHQPTLDQCWEIAASKSGAWFALGCYAGARVATADVQQLEHLGQVGHHLGMLIQIGDDIDGLWSRDGTRSDLANWPRWTLPVAYAMTVVDAPKREYVRACLHAASTDLAAEEAARRTIIEAGAVLYLVIKARQYHQAARQILLDATVSLPERDALLTLLDSCNPSIET